QSTQQSAPLAKKLARSQATLAGSSERRPAGCTAAASFAQLQAVAAALSLSLPLSPLAAPSTAPPPPVLLELQCRRKQARRQARVGWCFGSDDELLLLDLVQAKQRTEQQSPLTMAVMGASSICFLSSIWRRRRHTSSAAGAAR
ncbi:unnamed protein product, partial [Urochloa humidicola]